MGTTQQYINPTLWPEMADEQTTCCITWRGETGTVYYEFLGAGPLHTLGWTCWPEWGSTWRRPHEQWDKQVVPFGLAYISSSLWCLTLHYLSSPHANSDRGQARDPCTCLWQSQKTSSQVKTWRGCYKDTPTNCSHYPITMWHITLVAALLYMSFTHGVQVQYVSTILLYHHYLERGALQYSTLPGEVYFTQQYSTQNYVLTGWTLNKAS